MELLGTIVEILGPSLVLVKADEGQEKSFEIDEILKVFGEAQSELLAKKHNLPRIYIPKGEVRLQTRQNAQYYLAETFQDLVESKKSVERPSSLLGGIWAAQVVREKVLGPPSATLAAATDPIQIPKEVIIGDRIGKD